MDAMKELPTVWFGGNVKNTLERAIDKDALRVRIGKVLTEKDRLEFTKAAAAIQGLSIEYPGEGDDLFLIRDSQGILRPKKKYRKRRKAEPATDTAQIGLPLA